VSTAILLQQAGFKCAILEAHTLCFGTTGGTTAHLNTILDTPYPTMIKNFDRSTAQTVANATKAAIDLVRTNIEKYNIACDFQKTTAYLFSQTDAQTKELENIYETSLNLGIERALWNGNSKVIYEEDSGDIFKVRRYFGMSGHECSRRMRAMYS